MFGLYIHIPFCKHICNYCDFPKKIPSNEEQIKRYINKIKEDLLSYKDSFKEIDTIYIGGGTPNALPNDYLEDLLVFIDNLAFKVREYTIECNPELISDFQAKLFKNMGITRVSLGIQTFNDKGIKLLGRHHTKNEAINSIKTLKNNGINNINIDLIFGYFNESLADFKEDLRIFKELDLPHLSAYSLILEEKTMLYRLHKESELDEDLIADMYNYLEDYLIALGFKHYEISNFSKPGYESIHNIKYWQKDDYIGIGMGATSYFNHKRVTNSYLINKYLRNENKFIEELSLLDEKKETMMLGLRMMAGVNKHKYFERFNSYPKDDFPYQKFIDDGLLEENTQSIFLTEKGYLLGNLVFEAFL